VKAFLRARANSPLAQLYEQDLWQVVTTTNTGDQLTNTGTNSHFATSMYMIRATHLRLHALLHHTHARAHHASSSPTIGGASIGPSSLD